MLILWFFARSRHIENGMHRMMKKALRRWTELNVFDYLELMNLYGDYEIRQLKVQEKGLGGR